MWADFYVGFDWSSFELLLTIVTLLYLMKHNMLILFRLIKKLHTKIAPSSILLRNPTLPTLLHLHTTVYHILSCRKNIRQVSTLFHRLLDRHPAPSPTLSMIEILWVEVLVLSMEFRIKRFKFLQDFTILSGVIVFVLNDVFVHELGAALS